jgi:predicted regulator of Ras-like GTPase activity (Roadblock/LC7/MglB family)
VAPVPSNPVAIHQPAPTESLAPVSTNGTVRVTLAAIAATLPQAISHKIPANPDQFVTIPVDKILPQLQYGQVVMTAAELRECSPEYFAALAGHDDLPIALPLGDIIKQLTPDKFARRQQRRVEVPREVGPVFAANGQGLSIAKSASAPAASAVPAYRAQPTVTSTSAQSVPVPATVPVAPASKISMSPQALASLKAAASAPAMPRPAATPTYNPAPSPLRGSTPSPAAPASAPPPKKIFPVTAKPVGHLAVPLASVCPEWPQEVRTQLTDVDVDQHQILVPLELLEPAMKSGRVLFTWEEVASWLKPLLANPPTPKVGEMAVELPLKVIAPLFMGSQRVATQKRVDVDETIPDIFNGGNGTTPASGNAHGASVPQNPTVPRMPAPAARPEPAASDAVPASRMASLPAAPLAPASAPVPASANPDVAVEQVIGNAGSRLGAKEIVANAARLPGVSGALLVLSDGLLVTSNTPPAVRAETIAAFIPQMFGRMNQYTKELSLGPLQQLTLGVEDAQWHVVKCPNIYFAVLGKHGDTLPLNLLAQIAAELSSQSK